jgi:hexosaminidase
MKLFNPAAPVFIFLACGLLLVSCGRSAYQETTMPQASPTANPASPDPALNLLPKPESVNAGEGRFTLSPTAAIYVAPPTAELTEIGRYLAGPLRASTGYELPVEDAADLAGDGHILLTTDGGDPALGDEGYTLMVTPRQVVATAYRPAGLFYAVQTIRQLLPAGIEAADVQAGPWTMPAVEIVDHPRFAWRGAMLDVARHFFGVDEVRRYIDLMALYKLNRLHLHLTDDQGWRIMIDSWPRLALHGGSTAVGGGPGGYFTQSDYATLVAYAQSRYITLIPEIEMPGHTNAALASYAELNCDGQARPLYTGYEVGFSSLCIGEEVTDRFVDDVIRELAAITPGRYIHVGGDEALSTPAEAYVAFMSRVQAIVESYGKEMVGWGEIRRIPLSPTTLVQYWDTNPAAAAAPAELAGRAGLQLIMSPGSRTYLDMQYDPTTPLGLHWAGYIEVRDAYAWDPASLLPGIGEEAIAGVEAPLWSETLTTMADIEFMAFPRLLGIAEIGWSAAAGRSWDEYRLRLAAHGPRLQALGVNFYRSPQVDWK